MSESIDVVFSFDTTGSMSPCIGQVKREVASLVKQLFEDIPNIRIGVIAHGDYCDRDYPYVIKILDLTNDRDEIVRFVKGVERTGGGDAPECYELVLHEARRLTWSAGKSKVLVMIGDATPHAPSYPANTMNLDWKNEMGMLTEMGIGIYSVQCLDYGYGGARQFWKTLGSQADGYYLKLAQFRNVGTLINAVCYKQVGDDRLQEYEDLVIHQGRMDRVTADMFGTLTGRKPSHSKVKFKKADLEVVNPARFQVLDVPKDCTIRDFVEAHGLIFKKGRGFYEFTKRETVQEHKEVVLVDRASGDMYTGTKARQMIGVPYGSRGRVSPGEGDIAGYRVFIQSTSYNRRLVGGTAFLYEVDEWAGLKAA